jgi:nucleoside-diphosphate-sugar epimerase
LEALVRERVMKSSQDIIREDLDHIISHLQHELLALSGKKLLITGGAGFLGYYLSQAILYWNTKNSSKASIQLTVYDNYTRGILSWLGQLEKNSNLILVRHDIIDPLPKNIDDFHYIIHAASIASPVYYRMHPIETMDANTQG